MRKIIRIIMGILIMAGGIGLVVFGGSLLLQEQSWLILGGFTIFFALGVSVLQLGYSILQGKGVKEAWLMILFTGNRL
jgi:hypothetical protein